MRIKKEDIPVVMEAPGTAMRVMAGFGEMTVAYNQFPKGTDLGPLLEGLKNDSCPCPHWGYVVEGAMRMTYDDGAVELLEAGDVFYMPSGHTGIVEKDLKIIDFSPQKEFDELLEHVGKKMAEMGG